MYRHVQEKESPFEIPDGMWFIGSISEEVLDVLMIYVPTK